MINMTRRIMQLSILLVGLLLASGAWATTYYIDWVSGADTNNGITKSTPWKHAPGMYGCSNNCKSANPKYGDSIILKGGVTWPNASLGWLWIWSGNSTTKSPGCTGTGCIYIGADKTWYTGASWARPILNGEGSAVATMDGVANVFLRIYANYVIVDNLEFTGLYWSGTPAYGSGVNIAIAGGTPGVGTNLEIMNNYIHGWSHGTYAGGTHENACAIIGDTSIPNNNVNSIAHDNVIDGSDTDRQSCAGFFGGPPYIENNFIGYMANGAIINGTKKISGNTITNIATSFEPTAHMNGIEINASQDVEVSNNLIAHLGSGTLGLWVAPYPGYTTTVYNNVMHDTDTGNIFDIAPAVYIAGMCTKGSGVYCTAAGTTVAYNNTIECGQDANPNAICIDNIAAGTEAVVLKNNHFITNATTPNGGIWSVSGSTPVTATNNLVKSKTIANGQGYASTQQYPFSPTLASNGTVGAGSSLTSVCSSFSALCDSSTVGVSYNATSHTVTGPNRGLVRRDTWDIGAYQFGMLGMLPPQAFRMITH